MLKIAKDLELPDTGATQTWGFIARKGGGKSYGAMKLTEQLLAAGAPVVAIDTVGNWYGLRILADGKTPSPFQIPVFGGDHGDIPLDETQGKAVAELVVGRNLSAVIDVSAFSKSQCKRFVADFAETLFQLSKKVRTVRMVIFEEAQIVAPQNAQPDEKRMLGAVESIVRLGRNYGLGSTLISQRPQSVNKEVLNQVEALFVGQLSGAHERKAIESWVVEQGGADRDWLKELPTLSPGEMMFWSPSWMRLRKKVKIGKKLTLDASATPELGKVRTVATPKALDVGELAKLLDAAKEKPAGKGRAAGHAGPSAADVAHLQIQLEDATERAQRFKDFSRDLLDDLQAVIEAARKVQWSTDHPSVSTDLGATVGPAPKLTLVAKSAPVPRTAVPAGDGSLKAGALRMLTMLATFYPGTMTRHQIAKAADMKVTGGTFASYWSALNTRGLIEQHGDKLYRASAAGLALLGSSCPEVPKTMNGRLDFWKERLKAGEVRMLDTIVQYKTGISRDGLGKHVGMQPSGGTFSSYLSTLTTNKLVAKDGDGRLVAHPWLLTGADHG